jgi:hypothetical protein
MVSSFKQAIAEHLQLKERNRWLEPEMPLRAYRTAGGEGSASDAEGSVLDPDGPAGWPSAEGLGLASGDELWDASASFGWAS